MDAQPVRFLGRREVLPLPPAHEKELDADDPYEIVGFRYPVADGPEADRVLARCFVEEYALMGWSPSQIRELFTTSKYAGAFEIAARRGMELVDAVIAETFGNNDPEVR